MITEEVRKQLETSLKAIPTVRKGLIAQESEADDLKKKIDNDENIFLLDVRTPQEYDAWRISYDKYVNPKLIPVDRLFVNDPTLLKEIPMDKEIVTVCAHGNRSGGRA